MSKDRKALIDNSSKKNQFPFVNRELAWLSFNERVLQEANDPTTPLLERLKFLSIYSNNRDEFYRVRVASVKRMVAISSKVVSYVGEKPEIILEEINRISSEQQEIFEKTYDLILKELKKENIHILNENELSEEQKSYVKRIFDEEISSNLFPVLWDEKSKHHYLQDNSSYLFVKLILQKNEKKVKYALIELPTKTNPRFIVLPSEGGKHCVIFLDDVVRYCSPDFFMSLGFLMVESYNIKVTRDAELEIDNDLSQDIISKLSKSLKKRKKGRPVRLVVDGQTPAEMLTFLMQKLNFGKNDKPVLGGRYHNFKDFFNFPTFNRNDLLYQYPAVLRNPYLLDEKASVLNTVRQRDLILFYPYQTFDHIIAILREASVEPTVVSIQMTLYRVASISKVANALINAIKNGKKVTVVVELQARFDEENNIYWSNKLREEGVFIIYGLPDLKVHAKLFLITAIDKGREIRYGHVGTGNFNEKTAKVYTDASLLTCDQRITNELQRVFDYFGNKDLEKPFEHLLVAPINMRQKYLQLIEKETSIAKSGGKAFIILKLNHLVDIEMINKLYKASQAGVKIQLIIRGNCSILCEVPGLSENISGVSIVDKYLEHTRLLIFGNNGDPLYFLSSGDWMTRNFDSRCEVAVPVYNQEIKTVLKAMIDLQLSDNCKARILDGSLSNLYVKAKEGEKSIRSQDEFYKFLYHRKEQILKSRGVVSK